MYVLGAEDQGLPPAVVRACTHCVSLDCAREASFNGRSSSYIRHTNATVPGQP